MSNRVLVIGEYGSLNGGENSFLTIAPALINSGWEFHAAVPADSDFASALKTVGIETHDLEMQTVGGQRKSQQDIRAEIASIANSLQPDLIHCNSLSISRLCGPVAKALGIPGLGYLRDILKLSKKAIADINALDRHIAVSNATRDWHCEQGIDPKKTSVVFNGVDSDLFSPLATALPTKFANDALDPIKAELDIATDSPILLFVGQIGIRKGVDTLVDAFSAIADAIADVHLLIVGQRHSQKQEAIEYERRLKEQSEASPHRRRIHWLGVRNDVPNLMRAATLLIHPARQEPLGRVLLEAAATGLPTVTTRVGGSPEILSGHQLERLLVEPGDSIALATKAVELLNQTDQQKQIGARLRAVAIQNFSVSKCAQTLDQHYSWLVRK